MKVLRVRRGYTTNSSSTNEWFPSKSPPKVDGPTPTPLPLGKTIIIMPITSPSPTPQPHSSGAANAAKIGGLVVVVVLLFALERVVRHFWRRMRS